MEEIDVTGWTQEDRAPASRWARFRESRGVRLSKDGRRNARIAIRFAFRRRDTGEMRYILALLWATR